MPIIHKDHSKGSGSRFARVASDIAIDKRLSLSARVIMQYLLSQDSKWVIRTKDLVEKIGITENTVDKALAELRKAGYLHTEKKTRYLYEYPGDNPHYTNAYPDDMHIYSKSAIESKKASRKTNKTSPQNMGTCENGTSPHKKGSTSPQNMGSLSTNKKNYINTEPSDSVTAPLNATPTLHNREDNKEPDLQPGDDPYVVNALDGAHAVHTVAVPKCFFDVGIITYIIENPDFDLDKHAYATGLYLESLMVDRRMESGGVARISVFPNGLPQRFRECLTFTENR